MFQTLQRTLEVLRESTPVPGDASYCLSLLFVSRLVLVERKL